MDKALTRDDLLYILQSIFKLSKQQNNAFQMLEDGLFVEDYHVDLSSHATDIDLHVNQALKQILNGFTISETGILLYDGVPVSMILSSKDGNSISIEEDGLYVPDVNQEAKDHLEDEDIHVTTEDKENWNQTLEKSKSFTLDEISKLVIYNIEIVYSLPESITVPVENENAEDEAAVETEIIPPSSTTLYLLANDPDCPEECTYTMHMYLNDQWVKLNLTNKTLNKFALKTEVENAIDNAHAHDNKNILDKFDEDENGKLMYDNANIHELALSTQADNAAKIVDGKLYVKDLEKELQSLQISAAWSKINLYSEEISNSGVYELKDYIDNYNLILVEYYYKPNDENEQPGCAKTAIIDTDTLKYLYSKNIEYMLEYGYGILTSNSKIRMHEDKLWVDYYHNVCIYKITGIRKGDDNE